MNFLSRLAAMFRRRSPAEVLPDQQAILEQKRVDSVAAFMKLPEVEQIERFGELAEMINGDDARPGVRAPKRPEERD